MSESSSQTTDQTATATTHIADSYNDTFNKVLNLSGGNVNLNLGGGGDDSPQPNVLPYVLGGIAILALVAILGK